MGDFAFKNGLSSLFITHTYINIDLYKSIKFAIVRDSLFGNSLNQADKTSDPE